MPLRSLPDEAAVGEALGTLLVSDAETRTRRERNAELVRHDLRDLGEQALAHLGAAVVQEHRAVVVHVQRARRPGCSAWR